MMKKRNTAILLAAVLTLSLSGCYLRDSSGTEPGRIHNVPDEEPAAQETVSGNTTMEVQIPEPPADSPAEQVPAMPPQEETTEETEPAEETESEAPLPVPEPEETVGDDVPIPETEPKPDPETKQVQSISLDRTSVEIAAGLSDMPWVTMLPEDAADKSEIWMSSDESIATVDPYGRILGIAPGQCTVTVTSGACPDLSAEVRVTVYSGSAVTEPTYIDGILIVNKSYPLPETYNPGVDPDAQTALDALIAGAALDEVYLWQQSGFRSYETQKTLYNNYVARDGKEEADRYSARPGHSEHQTGLAFDLNSLDQSFGETKEGIWLAEHCAEYGFIIRYPAGKEEVTGYMYEPWHIRYIGTETAKLVTESGLCLEEYFGIPSCYAY